MLIVICLTALLASLLTFFSGFGLGTILMPVFALFFPIEIAIALTAVVHLLNNIFKLFLVGITKQRAIIVRFGIPSMLASFIGAWCLNLLSGSSTAFNFQLIGYVFETNLVNICIASLIIIFTLFEISPQLQKIQFGAKHLTAGGLISGFFGGLSGNQGALRSMFLIKAKLSKEDFIATGVLIACMVDVARLPVYATKYWGVNIWENKWMLVSATLSAFVGAYLGSKFLKKITLDFLHYFVTGMLMVLALLLGFGII